MIHYLPGKDRRISLKEIRKKLEEKKILLANWEHSLTMSAVHASKEWSIRPSVLGVCLPSEDLDYMLAYLENKQLMDFVDEQTAIEDAEDKSKSKGKQESKVKGTI